MRQLGELVRAGTQVRGELAVALDHAILREDVERGERGGAGERIAGVAVRVQERALARVLVVERVEDGVAGEHHRQRQVAARQALRKAEEIGRDASLLAGEHRPGAAEADRDLVGDQVHAVPVAGGAQQLEVDRVIHAHARGALHQRLDDDCADLVRVPGQERVHRGEGAPAVRFPAFAVLAHVAIGRGRA